MKKMTAVILAGWMCASIMASQATEPAKAPVAAGAASMAEKVGWMTSFEAAKAEAAKRKVLILVSFSGSDWCELGLKLEKEVFSKPAFKDYAARNCVLLQVDFPRRKQVPAKLKKQNMMLVEKYDVEGFPTVLLLDAEGKELVRTGYQPGGPERYVEYLQKALQWNKRS